MGIQGHCWCDPNPAKLRITSTKSLSLQSWTLSMACTILLPGAGLLSRCLTDVQGEWNNFQVLLFTARGAHSVRDTQGHFCGTTSESFLPWDHIHEVSPQSQKIPFHPA